MSNEDTSHKELPGPWAKTYSATSKTDMLDAYSEWAASYDNDSIKKFGYIAPKRAAQVLSNHIERLGWSKDCHIMDIGCGTGLVGEELHDMGYGNITGLDYSNEMLQIAQTKQCYKQLHCVDLTHPPTEIESITGLKINSIDAMISVGTFTPNHVGIQELLNSITFLKPGGILVLSLRDDFAFDDSNGFRAKLEELEGERVRRRDVTEPELYTHKVSTEIFFRCWVFSII